MHISGIPSELYRPLGGTLPASLFRRERNSLKKAVAIPHTSSNTAGDTRRMVVRQCEEVHYGTTGTRLFGLSRQIPRAEFAH